MGTKLLFRTLAVIGVCGSLMVAVVLLSSAADAQCIHWGPYGGSAGPGTWTCSPERRAAVPPPGPSMEELQQRARQQDVDDATQWEWDEGISAYKNRDYAGAVKHFKEALSYTPDDPGLQHNLLRAEQALSLSEADALNEKGLTAYQNRNYATALSYFRQAQALEPNVGVYNMNIALAQAAISYVPPVRAAISYVPPVHAAIGYRPPAQAVIVHRAEGSAAFQARVAAVPSQSAALIQPKIAGIRDSLKQLNKAMTLDASQRKEWDAASANATQSAFTMAGSATLDLLGAHVDHKIKEADQELKRSVDLLSSSTDTNRRDQLHSAFSALKARKTELVRLRGSIEETQGAYSGSTEGIAQSQTSKREAALESIWSAGEKLKIIGPEGSAAKSIVDACYLVTVQAASVLRIRQLNRNQDQYLAALKVLKTRMETLVKASKQ